MTDAPSDVNERVTEEWKVDTTPGERVRTVMKRTYDPQSVGYMETAPRPRVSLIMSPTWVASEHSTLTHPHPYR